MHKGEHDAIVDPGLFERVQAMLDGNARRHRTSSDARVVRAPLSGKLFDATAEPMSPTFSRGKSGRSYRYYVSTSLQQGRGANDDHAVRRLPAPAIERVIGEALGRWTGEPSPAFDILRSVRLGAGGIAVELVAGRFRGIAARLAADEAIIDRSAKSVTVLLPLALPLRGGRRLVVAGSRSSPQPDAKLIAALRKAHRMLESDAGMPIVKRAPVWLYDRRILRLAFIAPDIQRDILGGRHPPALNLQQLVQMDLPLAWSRQREVLGWPGQA